MKRTNIYLTDEQHKRLTEMAQASGLTVSDYIRRSIDWHLSQTVYIQDTTDMLEEIHPDMTPEQLVGWLQFRWRLRHEGKDRNGNGGIVRLLRLICNHLGINTEAIDADK